MKNQVSYNGVFENKFGLSQIVIKNDFKYLSFELGSFRFEGTSFDDFELLDYDSYSKAELERFSLNKISSGQGFVYELCDCSITVYFPLFLRDVETKEVLQKELEMKVQIGKNIGNGMIEDLQVSLNLNMFGKKFVAVDYDFEDAANEIQKQIAPRYRFNNCFGCNYSDYSPYGKTIFGDMLCFKNQKKEYVKVKNKLEFFKLNKADSFVQEIYCCEEFEIRRKNIGYRG
ncbi:hypothetical protein GWK08_16540 [Leptobacterium flavescens]|uniref:Uncharacterized protein n=1 Tax=Leptobacterium flavescens TaxID=472055 RepID=A0A6P0UP17_9FLAO|nr:DUF6304 family protein [Leptobacterium flavescens]NER15064.1 hypothetical protein [Leptobacterium flavescens]